VEVHLVPFYNRAFDISCFFAKTFDFRMEHGEDNEWRLWGKVSIPLLTLSSTHGADTGYQPDTLEVLKRFGALQVLDLAEQVVLDHEEQDEYDDRHFGTTPNSSFTYRGSFDRLVAASTERKAIEQRYEEKLEEAQKAAARSLVQSCPTLRPGWWWRTVWLDGQQVYERRGWTAKRSGDEVFIDLYEGVQWLPTEFTDREQIP
jgi:hypothetical protein